MIGDRDEAYHLSYQFILPSITLISQVVSTDKYVHHVPYIIAHPDLHYQDTRIDDILV